MDHTPQTSLIVSSFQPQQLREYELRIPTENDFASLSELQDLAFVEKRGWFQPIFDCRTSNQRAYEFYAQNFPSKIYNLAMIASISTVWDHCTHTAAFKINFLVDKHTHINNSELKDFKVGDD
jgi:hypothetical protein